jgi:predicted nucleotidyltransferase
MDIFNIESRYDTSLWEKITEEKSAALERERIRVRDLIPDILRGYFAGKCTAVFLTGSLLLEGRFGPDSDIDVAVEGLAEGYFRVIADLEHLLDRDIDLIELESCHFREKIIEGGMRIL